MRHAFSTSTVTGSRSIVRRPVPVFTSEISTSYAIDTNAWRTDSRLASKSTSHQRRPSTSPRRIPVCDERWNAGWRRWSRTESRNVRSCLTSHALMLPSCRFRSVGASASETTLRMTMPLRWASFIALLSIRWMLRTVFGASPTGLSSTSVPSPVGVFDVPRLPFAFEPVGFLRPSVSSVA